MSPRLLVPILNTAGPAPQIVQLVEEDWVVPRLVERISELEEKLYGSQIEERAEIGGAWFDKIGAALRSAVDGVDASLAYIAGEDAVKSDSLHQATASALKITVRKLSALKDAAASLEDELKAAQEEAAAARRRADAAEAELDRLRGDLTAETQRAAGLESALRVAEGAAERRAAATQDLHCTRTRLEEAQRLAEDFQRRFLAERLERRRLHEELQALRGNIRVVCRARPSLSEETPTALSFPMDAALRVASPVRRGASSDFEFSGVLRPEATQEDTFGEVWPALRSCLDGHNVCIFAYGQTGAGKTRTMIGDAEDPGVAPRALKSLFQVVKDESEEENRILSVSMLEIYMDNVKDLLASPQPSKPLEVLGLGPLTPEQLAEGVDRVPGRTWRLVSSAADAVAVLAEGAAARATAATSLNAVSSRSHLIFSVKIQHSGSTSGGACSLLNLVDLAGSERVARSEAEGQQLKEAQAINKSLSALGDVVAALQARTPHVPYRNSKLTAVLQDALGRGSKVLLLCCVAPEEEAVTETLSTLAFAQRAAAVELGPSSSSGGSSGGEAKTPKPGVNTPSPVLARPGSRIGAR